MPSTRAPATRTPEEQFASDTVWYVSNRSRSKGKDTEQRADSLEYGFAIHRYRQNADAMTGALDVRLQDSVQLSADAFLHALQSSTQTVAGDTPTVLYVHGFGTSLHECWRYAAEARVRSSANARWVVFCWPSHGNGIVIRRKNPSVFAGYVEDSIAASRSVPALVQTATTLLSTVPASQLLLVSHSLGAQLMSAALRDSTELRARLVATPARAVAFIAADIDVERFATDIIPSVVPLATRVVNYTSEIDRVLAMSRAHSGRGRAGLQRGNTPLPLGVESVDATSAVVAEGFVQRRLGTHHAIRRASGVVFDLLQIVGAERAPECRTVIGTATLASGGIWRMTRSRPDTAALSRCETHRQNSAH